MPDDATCRICFEDDEPLLQPCHCTGSHAFVHEACLFKWRHIQVLRGMTSAATRCEICGQKYASALAPPKLSVYDAAREYICVLTETIEGLVFCGLAAPQALAAPVVFVFTILPSLLMCAFCHLIGVPSRPGGLLLQVCRRGRGTGHRKSSIHG